MADQDPRLAQLWPHVQKGQFAQEIWDQAERIQDPFEFKGKMSDALKEIIKRTHPGIPQEGYDAERRVNQRIDSLESKQEAKERKAREEAEDAAWKAQLDEVRKRYKYNDDDMKRLDKFMRERQIYNPEDAAMVLNQREPKMTDAGDSSGMFHNYQKQDGWDEVSANPEKWAHDQIYAAAKRQELAEKNQRF